MIELVVSAFLAATALQADESTAAATPAEAQAEVAAQDVPTPAPAEPAAVAAPEKPKKTCRRLTGTGSRMDSGKVCKTAVEWKRFDAEQ